MYTLDLLYVILGMCAEIVDVPSFRVPDLECGLNLFNRRYARFYILLPATQFRITLDVKNV